MSRSVAVAVLAVLALAFCCVAFLALREIWRFEAEMRACAPVVALDYSSFWLGSCFGFVALPLLGASRSEIWHLLMFVTLGALLIFVPLGLHHRTIGIAGEAGYSTAADPGVFHLNVVEFGNADCG